jgi:hypothetical protein
VLVIVAGRHDKKARNLAKRWAPWDAAVLTCEDLSMAGWRHLLDDPEDSEVVIGGQAVAAREITGVLTRLSYVPERELRRIVQEDRAYVAAEMTAFLCSWLAGLRCPVLNRPTPTCLSGPGWRRERWVYAAARLGIPVQPVTWDLEYRAGAPEDDSASPDTTVTVVGARCLGTTDDTLVAQARRLAGAAGADLLAVHFNETSAHGFRLHSADPWADISSPGVADALLEHFREAGRC